MRIYEIIHEGYSHAVMKKNDETRSVPKDEVEKYRNEGWALSYWAPDEKASKPGRKKKKTTGSFKIRK